MVETELLKRSVCKDLIQKEGLVAELLRKSDPLYGFLILNTQDVRAGKHPDCRHRNIVGALYLKKSPPQLLIFGACNREVGDSIAVRVACHLQVIPITTCSILRKEARVYEQTCSVCAPETSAIQS